MATSLQPRSVIRRVSHKVSTKDGWLGEYDYGWLCLPSLPFSKNSHEPPFYALDAELPLLLAMASGLQHALAMLAGLITPPIIFASALNLDPATSSYMISASLIGCGILSLVQISRIRLFGGYFLGTGLISGDRDLEVVTYGAKIFDAMYRDGTCTSTTNADGTATRNACPDAYGKLLGTSLICSFLEMLMAFVPPRVLKRFFPPIVTGQILILSIRRDGGCSDRAGLIGDSGALNWGGGSNGCQDFPTSGIFQLCPTIFAPRPLPWASPEFIGLGFLSFISIILTELLDHPPAITFLWVHTFKIGVYPPAILPISLAMEAIGDITASAEVSKVDVRGLEFDSRIQGGILSDGLGGFISALFTVTPLSIFAQNNGVIAITRCANRAAGRWCCTFLILFGILGKISGTLLAIPNPVLGGVTTFLFATVTVSGLRVLSFNKYTRRDRFVLATAMSFGIGDLLAPQMFTHLFDGVNNPNSSLEGLFNSITIILSTPFLAAGIVAVLLNLILPIDHHEITDSADADVDEEKELGSPGGSDV
ncbi:xanthine/uracil permease [Mycena leptocephala]|nr:xanthine/uracil permease [Mycena leptocephala]